MNDKTPQENAHKFWLLLKDLQKGTGIVLDTNGDRFYFIDEKTRQTIAIYDNDEKKFEFV